MLIGLLGMIVTFGEDTSKLNWNLLQIVLLVHGFIVAYYSLYKIFMSPNEEYERRRYKKFDTKTMKIE